MSWTVQALDCNIRTRQVVKWSYANAVITPHECEVFGRIVACGCKNATWEYISHNCCWDPWTHSFNLCLKSTKTWMYEQQSFGLQSQPGDYCCWDQTGNLLNELPNTVWSCRWYSNVTAMITLMAMKHYTTLKKHTICSLYNHSFSHWMFLKWKKHAWWCMSNISALNSFPLPPCTNN